MPVGDTGIRSKYRKRGDTTSLSDVLLEINSFKDAMVLLSTVVPMAFMVQY